MYTITEKMNSVPQPYSMLKICAVNGMWQWVDKFKKYLIFYEDASDTGFSTCEEAHHSLIEILGKLEIIYHFSHFQLLESHFGFPCSVESLINHFDPQNH
jgi:hypothetical protein